MAPLQGRLWADDGLTGSNPPWTNIQECGWKGGDSGGDSAEKKPVTNTNQEEPT
jgi:hypothetical protein